MARSLELEELVDHFTLAPDELGLLRSKAGTTRLGFGVLLKFVQWRGRFPAGRGELPENAMGHVARQVGVAESEIARYDFDGRQIKAHRAEIRRELGPRGRAWSGSWARRCAAPRTPCSPASRPAQAQRALGRSREGRARATQHLAYCRLALICDLGKIGVAAHE